jgi:uncharacterized protein (DUF1778 family)
MSAPPKNDARIDFRLSKQAKESIERAAALSGQSVSDFAVSSLLEKAQDILESERVRSLSERDAEAFLRILESTEKPNDALRRAGQRHRGRAARRSDD